MSVINEINSQIDCRSFDNAVNGLQSLQTDKNKPDCIFLDLNMPLMNGFEFLQWRRQQPVVSRIPVLILTSSENPQDIVDAYRLGANAYLVKPMAVPDLSSLLTSIHAFWFTHNHFAI